MAGRSTLGHLSEVDRKAYGARIRRAADVLGTQGAAADALDISLAQLKNYFAGKSAVPHHVLAKLADKSAYRLEWLMSGEGSPTGPKTGTERLVRAAGQDPDKAAVLVGAIENARRLHALLEATEERVTAALQMNSNPEQLEEVVAVTLQTVAPNNTCPEDWEDRLDGVVLLIKILAR